MADVVVFKIGTQQFAIPLSAARELFRIPTITPLPKAPPIIEGVINVRGRVVPVLNIRERFNIPGKTPHPDDHIVVASAGTRLVAFRVDQAIGLTALAKDDIEEAKTITPRSEYLAGVAKLPDGLVLIHDPSTFLATSEAQGLDAALSESAVRTP